MAKSITKAQITKIWTKADELGMTEEQLRDLIKWVSGQESTRELTKRQGIRLIDVMEGKKPIHENTPLNPLSRGEEQRFLSPRKFPKVIGRFLPLATQKQLSLIENLKIEARWDGEHLKNYIRKQHKVDSIQELDIKRAGNVIDVLKREKQKRMNEATHVLS